MFKRIFALFISLFTLATFTGCNDTNVEPLSDEEKAALVSNSFSPDTFFNVKEGEDTNVEPLSDEEKAALVSNSFSPDTFFNVKEGEDLTNEEIRDVVSNIPSEKYESYPDIHNIPLTATLYKDGESILLERNDPRLIGIINFFNNCVYHSQCAYTQGLLPLDYLEKNVTGSDFRLELKYTPCSNTGPMAYGKSTTGCDTIIITNSSSGFTLIAHEIPGYDGQEEAYPYRAVGFAPLYNSYPWLELFGF